MRINGRAKKLNNAINPILSIINPYRILFSSHEKLLNLSANNGKLEIMSIPHIHGKIEISHDELNNRLTLNWSYSNINGTDATNKPTEGDGRPMKLSDWRGSLLNFAKRIAAQIPITNDK